ncbi:MAG: hypothetical protein ACQET6_14385 [Bacillota bacterium]
MSKKHHPVNPMDFQSKEKSAFLVRVAVFWFDLVCDRTIEV